VRVLLMTPDSARGPVGAMSCSSLSPARACYSRALPAVGRDRAVGRPRSRAPLPQRSSAARVRRCHDARRVDVAAGSGGPQYTTHTEPAPVPPPGAGIDQGAIKDVALFWIIGGVAYYLKMQVISPTLLSPLTATRCPYISKHGKPSRRSHKAWDPV